MKDTNIRFEKERRPAENFRCGVSLHSHTLYSRESLDFIYQLALRVAPIRAALRHGEARYRMKNGRDLDLSRAWWTPPLAPHDAWRLEADHICGFDLDPLISLTDHDNIEAPMTLQVLEECCDTPVSVE
jgi:hypothetical protein